ncbi:MAG: RecX family transcriptional regulator [candidate division WOR-3 bacterium]
MRITGLRPQKRGKKRLSVFVDGAFAFSLDKETVARFRLKEGKNVTAQFLEEVVLDEQYRQCRDYAFLLLSYRARSRKELTERLKKKGYSEKIIERVMNRLIELGLIDDERLARDFVESRIKVGHKGKWRVRAELLKLGIPKEMVEREIKAAPDEVAAAEMVVEHYLPRYRNLDPKTRKRRLIGLLARRGFSPETIARVLKAELGLNE